MTDKALLIAQHDNRSLHSATLNAVTAAQQLAEEVSVLIAGQDCQAVATQAASIMGIHTVLLADQAIYAQHTAENMAALIVAAGKAYNYLLAPATTFGKNIMPRVAALLDVAQISDIVQIIAADLFVRPIYAGNALATVQSLDPIKVITVRTTAFAAATYGDQIVVIKRLNNGCDLNMATFIEQQTSANTRPELTQAKIIVAGGRGLESADKFTLLEQLADRLQAAIGATRAAVDAGFVPNEYQVGQTGKVVAPELYIAIGISGAIQHLAGMKDSKVIVAINKDPEAPIFQIATYGLTGDLFTIVPELIAELDKVL